MSDDSTPAANPNPFDHIDLDSDTPTYTPKPAAEAPAAPAAAATPPSGNPFDTIDLDSDKLNYTPKSTPSGLATFAEHFAKGIAPLVGSTPLVGAGFAAGAELGTPFAPFTYGLSIPVGGFIGAMMGGYAGSTAISSGQDYLLKQIPETAKTLGLDEATQRAGEQSHSIPAFLGDMAPFALLSSPVAAEKAIAKLLPANATPLQKLLAHPLTAQLGARLGSGAVIGAQELGQETVSGQGYDPLKLALATGFGIIFNHPTRIGDTLLHAGARPAAFVFGKTEAAPVTIAQAGDLKVIGPGITEDVFQGSHAQAPEAAMAAQQKVREEQAALAEPPEPDVRAIAKQMDPELFARYEELLKRQQLFAGTTVEGSVVPPLSAHLAATEAEIAQLAPDVAAAYRRAQDTVGTGSVEPEPFGSFAEMLAARETQTGRPNETPQAQPAGEPGVPSGGEAPVDVAGQPATVGAVVPGPARTIGDQRAFIANDVTQKLIAAGRPEEEAKAAGQLLAARYVTRAGRFAGKLGTPEELYAREGAAIAGPTGKAQEPGRPPSVEGVQKNGLPSNEPAFSFGMGSPDEDIGPHSAPVNAALDAVDRIDELSPAQQKRDLPAYSPAAEQAPKGVDQPAGVFMFDPLSLGVDASRFQFKSGGDEYGVTGALRNVTKWDPAKAQSIIVWEANDGKLFVADGHQRAGLARRLTEQDKAKDIQLPGVLYREKDGISAGDIKAIAAVTNIANGSGSALDGAKVLRSRPDLMDGSLPLSVGKGKQAAALARLGDEPFRMVVNDVIPEHYGAVVGELIPNDPARQEAAIKAIVRFEPKNADEAAVLIQRVAQAELAKREAGAQSSMFGDLETPESTAGEEMKIVGRAIGELKKDKALFSRVLANASRIEQTGSSIEREAAAGVASDAEIFAKTLTSDAYTQGPIRTELVAAARDLKNGKTGIADASGRILDALRSQAETHGADRAGTVEREPEVKEFAQADQDLFEPGAEGKPQGLIPGVAPVTQRDLVQAAANKPLAPKVAQKPVGGLFGDSMDQKELFQTAYHGSPYHFDMFDTGKIGTGEGAQAYGHGLYFAENEKVGKRYQDALSPRAREAAASGVLEKLAAKRRRLEGLQADLKDAEENPHDYFLPEIHREIARAKYDIAGLEPAAARISALPEGNLYRVDIKPEPHEFLQWDRPLKEQSQKVQDAVYDALRKSGLSQMEANDIVNRKTGEDAYRRLARQTFPIREEGAEKFSASGAKTYEEALAMVGGDKSRVRRVITTDPVEGSKILKELGVPGIRYLDEGSRSSNKWVARHPQGGTYETPNEQEARDFVARNPEYTLESPHDNKTHNYVVFDPKDIQILDRNGKKVSEAEYNQTARGKIRISEGQRPLITLMKEANASTFVHESGHQFLEEMMRDAAHPDAPADLKADAKTALDYIGAKSADEIQTKHHEKFARGFEQYLREGVAPSKDLAGVFAKFRNWLLSIYQSIKGLGAEISPDIRNVFDRLLEQEPQRTVIAPDQIPGGPQLHEIHEAEAAYTESHEAEASAARIDAEADRYVNEPPPGIAHEITPIVEKIDATAAAAAGTEPAGKTGTGPGQGGQMEPGGGGSEPEPAGGGVGAGGGEKLRGGGEPAPESAVDQRAGLDKNPATALAPGPSLQLDPHQSPFIDKAGNIRLENLSNSAEVRQAIRDAAEENNDFIGDRRGVVTDGQVGDLANDIGLPGALDLVNNWVKGQAYNAEQVTILRRLLRQSAIDVSAAMKKAAIGTDEDVQAYAIARDRHQMIQRTVSGATAEAGRALRAFRNIAGEEGSTAKALDEIIKIGTGKTLFQLREEAKLGAKLDTPEKISKFMMDAQSRTFGRMLLEYFVNTLISGPITHITYGVGNEISAIMRAGPETAAAATIGAIQRAWGRQGERVRFGEVGAQFKGKLQALPGAVQAASEAARSGLPTLLPGETAQPLTPFTGDTQLVTAKTMTNAPVTWSEAVGDAYGLVKGVKDAFLTGAEVNAAGVVEGAPTVGLHFSPLGQIPDVAIGGKYVVPVGSAVRLPGRMVAAEHSFFRTMNYAMNRSAEAFRIATDEVERGVIPASAKNQRIAEITLNPSQDQMDRWAKASTESSLMGQGGAFVQNLSRLLNTEFNIPGVGPTALLKFIDPFVKISGNIVSQSIVHRTPVGLLSPEIRADLLGKNGNIAQDMAQARMLVGTALSLTVGGLAAAGYISGSGPSDPKLRAAWLMSGVRPHSVRIGDFWYDYHRLGPIGMLGGIAADMYDVAHEASQGDLLTAAAHLHHAFTQNVLDESFMKGPADLIKAVEDPGRYGEGYVKNFLSSFTPFSVGSGQITRLTDPYQREARTVVDSIRAKLPWSSQGLYAKIDVWGQPTPSLEGLGELTAIYEHKISTDPVNQAMFQLGFFPAKLERTIRNVQLTDEQYDYLARNAGRLAKSQLDQMVRSQDWALSTPEIRRLRITDVFTKMRETARGMTMDKWRQIPNDAGQLLKQKKSGEVVKK